jgi:aspartyl-tRNA(Asn)/glutamyl-tRNA(Gln) amidotransferase subunit B
MNYKTTIGLEIHVQLKTKSKMFCGCDNNAEGAEPNTFTCPVCMGLPGVLPVANVQAIEWIVKTGLALNGTVNDFSKFDRKHYFYPDLPKGYQISQYDLPFATGGWLEIRNPNDEIRKINITRIHLEEDAGKLIHSGEGSLVDLNRAGTPLMEIVTEPEINSPQEAKIFLQNLRAILRFLDVSDADMEKGHLRADANISVAQCQNSNDKCQMGIPTEIKNLNSFRMVERALLFEEKRQKELLEKGEKILKETRGWDDAKGITYSQRTKEQAQDYRYFPEPDLPPFNTTKIFNLEEIKTTIPELPAEKVRKYIDMGVNKQDAEILSLDSALCLYYEKVASKVDAKLAANWIINELKLDGLLVINPDKLIELIKMIETQEISGKIGKEVLAEMISSGKSAHDIILEKGFKQIGDETELTSIIENIIANNPQVIASIKAGKKEAVGFLIGQVMHETKGQANPQKVNEIVNKKIGEKNE